MRARALAIVCALATASHAQPIDPYAPGSPPPAVAAPTDPTATLHDANAAAIAGDWTRVSVLVDPLLVRQLARPDLAEAQRLAGLAAFFAQRTGDAETHFVAYLKLDPDAQLDPAVVPPEAINFFNDVRARHAAEIRAARPVRTRRTWVLNLVPPFGQFQNGERTKGWVLLGALGVFGATNLSTFFVLRSWCTSTSGPAGTGASCDATVDHNHASASLRTINIASGIGLIATYAFGVYDGVVGYRRRTREHYLAPYATSSIDGVRIGIAGSF